MQRAILFSVPRRVRLVGGPYDGKTITWLKRSSKHCPCRWDTEQMGKPRCGDCGLVRGSSPYYEYRRADSIAVYAPPLYAPLSRSVVGGSEAPKKDVRLVAATYLLARIADDVTVGGIVEQLVRIAGTLFIQEKYDTSYEHQIADLNGAVVSAVLSASKVANALESARDGDVLSRIERLSVEVALELLREMQDRTPFLVASEKELRCGQWRRSLEYMPYSRNSRDPSGRQMDPNLYRHLTHVVARNPALEIPEVVCAIRDLADALKRTTPTTPRFVARHGVVDVQTELSIAHAALGALTKANKLP